MRAGYSIHFSLKLLALTALLAVPASISPAEIRFSDPAENVNIPATATETEERVPNRGDRILKSRPGIEGLPAPSVTPQIILTPELKKMLEKERNWLGKDPDDFDTEEALQRAFGVSDSSLESGFSWRNKDASRFSRGIGAGVGDERSSSGDKGSEGDLQEESASLADSFDGRGDDEGESALNDVDLGSSLGPSNQGNLGFSLSGYIESKNRMRRPSDSQPLNAAFGVQPSNAAATGGFHFAPAEEPEGWTESSSESRNRFQKLLGKNSGDSTSSFSILNTLNLQADTTRFPINPVSPGRSGGALGFDPEDSGRNQVNVESMIDVGRNSRVLDSLRNSSFDGPSLAPSINQTQPASSPIMQPQPAVLEIPRRKF